MELGDLATLRSRYKLEYSTWYGMKRRCNSKTNPSWRLYGGRGIKVSKRWNIFENFLLDMGPKPSPEHSIDRINNNGNYSRKNCRWATRKEQMRNTRLNAFYTWKGETKVLAEWVDQSVVPYQVLYDRLYSRWPMDLALTLPKGTRLPKHLFLSWADKIVAVPRDRKLRERVQRKIYLEVYEPRWQERIRKEREQDCGSVKTLE